MIFMNISGAAAPTGKVSEPSTGDTPADPDALGFAAVMDPQIVPQAPQAGARLSGIPDPAPARTIPLPGAWDADAADPATAAQPASAPSEFRPVAEWLPQRRGGDPIEPVAADIVAETPTAPVPPPPPHPLADLPPVSPVAPQPATLQTDPPAHRAAPRPPASGPRSAQASRDSQPLPQAGPQGPLAAQPMSAPIGNPSDLNLPIANDPHPTSNPAAQPVATPNAPPAAAARRIAPPTAHPPAAAGPVSDGRSARAPAAISRIAEIGRRSGGDQAAVTPAGPTAAGPGLRLPSSLTAPLAADPVAPRPDQPPSRNPAGPPASPEPKPFAATTPEQDVTAPAKPDQPAPPRASAPRPQALPMGAVLNVVSPTAPAPSPQADPRPAPLEARLAQRQPVRTISDLDPVHSVPSKAMVRMEIQPVASRTVPATDDPAPKPDEPGATNVLSTRAATGPSGVDLPTAPPFRNGEPRTSGLPRSNAASTCKAGTIPCAGSPRCRNTQPRQDPGPPGSGPPLAGRGSGGPPKPDPARPLRAGSGQGGCNVAPRPSVRTPRCPPDRSGRHGSVHDQDGNRLARPPSIPSQPAPLSARLLDQRPLATPRDAGPCVSAPPGGQAAGPWSTNRPAQPGYAQTCKGRAGRNLADLGIAKDARRT